jgi:hypothetical protein
MVLHVRPRQRLGSRLLIEHPDLVGSPNDVTRPPWTEVRAGGHGGNSGTAPLQTTTDEDPVHRRPVSRLFGVIAVVVVANEALHLSPTVLTRSLFKSAAPTSRATSGEAHSSSLSNPQWKIRSSSLSDDCRFTRQIRQGIFSRSSIRHVRFRALPTSIADLFM